MCVPMWGAECMMETTQPQSGPRDTRLPMFSLFHILCIADVFLPHFTVVKWLTTTAAIISSEKSFQALNTMHLWCKKLMITRLFRAQNVFRVNNFKPQFNPLENIYKKRDKLPIFGSFLLISLKGKLLCWVVRGTCVGTPMITFSSYPWFALVMRTCDQ